MEFSPHWLEAKIKPWPMPQRYVVLASGGMDSMVLLHAMAAIAERLPAPVVALHFNHGLHSQAVVWEQRVKDAAASLGIAFHSQRLNLDPRDGALETRARAARYARLREWMMSDDCCLSAHHGDDQAETFLLQALRGAGPAGLASMPEYARVEPGWLARPLLACKRSALRHWADQRGLEWVEDPGNHDLHSPRNWLRHRVWPRIEKGWPTAVSTLGRSAALAAEASALIEEVAAETCERLAARSRDRLPVPALLTLSLPRRRAVLRYWLRRNGVHTPTAEKLRELEHEYVLRDPGARANLPLGEVEVRRFRNELFLVQLAPTPFTKRALEVGMAVDLGVLGRIELVADTQGPLAREVADARLELRFRTGGERLRPASSAHHRSLKKLLQERAVLPWMRSRLPLLYADGQLVAVGNLWVAAEFAGHDWRLDWSHAPALE